MKKKIIMFIMALALCVLSVIPAMAADDMSMYVVDEANLLTDKEEEFLYNTMKEISEKQKCSVSVVTVNGLEGKSVQDFADDYYDYNGYGYGNKRDGIMLLISMEDRDYYMTPHGFGVTAFTDYGIDYIGNKLKTSLSDGNYYKAFEIFANQCDDFITQARNGEPYDSANKPHASLGVKWIFISIMAGLIIAIMIVAYMWSKLKTVRRQPAASNYVKKGSMQVTERNDFFLYSTINKVAKPKNENNGSSTHVSSSGETHGGGGGKF